MDSGSERSDEDDEELKEDLNEKLTRLYAVRDDLYINLKAVDESLAELGYTVDSKDVKTMKRQAQTGIRIKGKLSFRGKQMAAEYFQFLDQDHDGYLSWEDLRAMRSLAEGAANRLGFLHEQEYMSWESWRMYMDDAGIQTDKFGRMDLNNFVKLRELMELRQPLARELTMVGMSCLPELLCRWATIKTLIAEVLAFRSEARSQDTRGLNYDEIQFVLVNADIVFTRPEFFYNMLDRALKEKTMESLMLRFLKRRYAQSPTKYTQVLAEGSIPQKKLIVEIDDIKYTKPSSLVAWLFAERPKETKKGLYRNLILFKWNAYRWIRYVDQVTRTMFNMAVHIRQRKIFEDFLPIQKLSTRENEKSQINCEVDILGQGGNVDEGIGVDWSFNKLDDTEQYLMRQRLPRDSGFAVFADFMLRADANSASIRETTDALTHFIKHHFDSEFKRNVQFRGIYVMSTKSEADGAQIIRVAFCWKRIVSLDAHFEQMLIPYCINDIIGTCTGSFKTSVSITDIITPASSFQLDTIFTARFEWIFSWRRFVLLGLLWQLRLALSAGYTEHHVREDSEDANEIMRRKLRTYFPWILASAQKIESWIKGIKSLELTFEFKTLSEVLKRLGDIEPWFKESFPQAVGSSPGWISSNYQAFTKYCSSALKEIFNGFKTSLEKKAVREEIARKERLYTLHVEDKRDPEADAQTAVLDKLKRLGIEMDVDDVFAKDAHDAKSMATTSEERLFRNDMQGMQMIEKLHSTVLGLHTIQIVLGKARLNFAFQGLDFMELMVKPPQTTLMKKEMEDRRLATLA